MNVDAETLRDALRVTGLGMGLVFASLGLLMLVMGGLERLFRPSGIVMRLIGRLERGFRSEGEKSAEQRAAPAVTPAPQDDRRRVAAIALALVRRRRQAGSTTQGRRQPAAGAWVAWGRMRQMGTRRGGGEHHR